MPIPFGMFVAHNKASREKTEQSTKKTMNSQLMNLACIQEGFEVRPGRGFKAKGANQGESASAFSGLLEHTLTSAGGDLSRAANEATKRPNTGQGWLEHFRNQLLSQGIPLKDFSLTPKALPELKELLMGEGFSEREVVCFLERLFHGDSGGEVKITRLFEKLSELRALFEKESRDPVLDVSALPHLETALRCFGLDVQQTKRLIDQARADGGGLNLKGFVQELKRLVGEMPQVGRPSSTAESAQQIRGILARIGLVDEAADVEGPISLGQFVQIVEDKLARLMPHRLSKGEMQNHVNRLLGHVLVESGEPKQTFSAKALYAGKLQAFPAEQAEESPTSERKGLGQGGDIAMYSAREATIDRPHTAGAETGQSARSLPLYVVNQVGRQMALGLRRGESQIRLQLRPPNLGSVQLGMDMKNNVLKLEMITEHHSVKELLMSHVHELRESLLEQGVKLERIDIQIHYNFGQSMADAGRNLNRSHSRRQGPRGASPISDTEQDIPEASALADMQSNALLDMFA
ncbi:MAG: flagellar hook-length control protein FliK [Desulfobacterales bacterium]|nr:flagellar hook-length control protein FliK [Desulfobacterales bacterium]